MGLRVKGRWSAPTCITTLERGNDEMLYPTDTPIAIGDSGQATTEVLTDGSHS